MTEVFRALLPIHAQGQDYAPGAAVPIEPPWQALLLAQGAIAPLEDADEPAAAAKRRPGARAPLDPTPTPTPAPPEG
ncbi:MAG: hypothetical protein JZU52_12715 [Lamprocystis purpurea]|jgi:hypothetical protein|uniref:hypothetical protein n=1 Tax=Lamprocystis purpurea TaxID=61598 RepID=UPI00037874C1|nr:hypothetical protein [Lamprocystis purpurea]MBV5274458.1 hypothetical protein [Lamprocystis purpurea]